MEDRSYAVLILVRRAQIRIAVGAGGDRSPRCERGLGRSGGGSGRKAGLQKVSTAHGLVRVAGIPGKRKRLAAGSLVVCPSELARHGRKLFGTFSAKCAKSL